SDHCRHTTFNTKLSDMYFDNGPYSELVRAAFQEYMNMRDYVYGDRPKDVCLMDIGTIGAKYLKKTGAVTDIDESDEINACSIRVEAIVDGEPEDWLVMFKNETHNHPTEIEPFGGAATCLGGAIRDPLSGRVYVYQAMRVTGAADPRKTLAETMKGKLPQRKITIGAAQGYSSYGNQIGLATGQVDEVYDEDYVAKRMEVGAVIGAAPADHVRRSQPEPGDVVILVGGRTGRDGMGGATGASKKHTTQSLTTCGAEVQKGNPPVERNIQRLFRRKEVSTLIKRCNDFGAGGVSVAIGELADGLEINLDAVPKKYEGLDGTELAISESQERMAVVVPANEEEAFKNFAAEENLEATTVARVVAPRRITMVWRGNVVLSLSRDFLDTNGAKQEATVKVPADVDLSPMEAKADPEEYLDDLNCCLKKGLIEMFDSTIGAATVLMPLGGKYQLTPEPGMAAKLPVTKGETETATIMTYGYDPQLAKCSPYHGAMYAVIDSVTKLVALGGDRKKARLTFQEFFGKLSTDMMWGKTMAALLGALKVQKELGIPAIGGKDSMSGTFEDINVPPALLSFAVCAVDANNVISAEFKERASRIVLLPAHYDENKIIDFEGYKKNMDRAAGLIKDGTAISADSVRKGGVFMTLFRMCAGNKMGAEISGMTLSELGRPCYGGIVLEIIGNADLEEMFEGVDFIELGRTVGNGKLVIETGAGTKEILLDDAVERWKEPLESVFPVRYPDQKKRDETVVQTVNDMVGCSGAPAVRLAKPKVVIPVFQGTNCEVDSARAFERAGADVDVHLIRNLDELSLVESIGGLATKIKESQIIMVPGGFSGGDEPDGSAKFITAVFRNPLISEDVKDLLENRDGLMLGICNGFQAFVKLGLLPYGEIRPMTDKSPTLTYNKIGRHVSTLVRTRVCSRISPWLQGCELGDVYTIPVSHGEGNFVCDEDLLDELLRNGQIATQYVDYEGRASNDIEFNPNGSVMAIEGITSRDGRIFGKMGHAERIGKNVYKNVPGPKDMKIFESGVNYFK
ncbi:MAG: phosphoribosylformylglycinamidine synthase, partial [Anaerovoracaceae bacterium]|nr:phosphoribosylformylglycinamidine synthase [Anaerovoracaceae bacterium]